MLNILQQRIVAILPVSHFSTRNPCSPRYLTPLEGLKVDCKSAAESGLYVPFPCRCTGPGSESRFHLEPPARLGPG